MSEGASVSVLPKNNVKSKEALLLDVTFRRVLEDTVNSVSDEKFCKIFGPVCENRKSVMTKLHKVFKSTVVKNALDELNTLVEEENIDDAMKRLADRIEGTRPGSAIMWRPPGNVQENLRSIDTQEKLKRKQCLEDWVVAKEDDVARKRQQLEKEVASLASQESCTLPRLKRLKGEVSDLTDCLRNSEKCLTGCVSVASAFSLLPDGP